MINSESRDKDVSKSQLEKLDKAGFMAKISFVQGGKMSFFKKFFIVFFAFTCSLALSAGINEKTGLTNDVIDEIKKSFHLSAAERVVLNALTNNELSQLALNREFLTKHNDFFSHTIETKGITNQERSGRCWLFAGLNVLRPKVIKKYKLKDFEFSETYLFFWDKMEKANLFLEFIIKSADRDILDREVELFLRRPVGDGGLWSYVVNLVEKYGVVPKDIMPETYHSQNSWVMTSLISRKLREDATELRAAADSGAVISELRKKKIEMLKVIYKLLVLNLGEPPTQFIWRYEDKEGNVSTPKYYTPEEYYNDVVGANIRDYVALMNYPAKEYNRPYQFDNARNMYDMIDPIYINLDITTMKNLTAKSVLDDEPVWFACDIIPDKDSKHGVLATEVLDYQSLLGIDYKIDKAERILYRESSGNHAMVFTGVDIKDGKPVKWLVEDSHGAKQGHNGHWTLYDDWFNEYVYVVIINKRYLPKNIREGFKKIPIHLPPWDPMIAILKS